MRRVWFLLANHSPPADDDEPTTWGAKMANKMTGETSDS
jgi:hypothetical protein